MPINTTSGAASIGRDVQFVVQHPLAPGGAITISNPTGFDAKAMQAGIESKRLGLPPIFAEVPNGWSGTIEFDRADSGPDDLANLSEATFWAGGQLYNGDIFQYITEVDGSTTSYHYMGCALKFDELGRYSADAVVKQRISFKASQRVNI